MSSSCWWASIRSSSSGPVSMVKVWWLSSSVMLVSVSMVKVWWLSSSVMLVSRVEIVALQHWPFHRGRQVVHCLPTLINGRGA